MIGSRFLRPWVAGHMGSQPVVLLALFFVKVEVAAATPPVC